MTDEQARLPSGPLPSPPSGGELPGVRGRSRQRNDAVHPVRTAERGELPCPEVGDRVELRGEVVAVSTVGSSWVVVRLDGRDHTVACWTENISALNGGDAP